MLHVALWEPEIPPNTGNIARLCVAVGARLHLVGRLGFQLDERRLRRAGLDYWPLVDLERHTTLAEFEAEQQAAGRRLWLFSARADRPYTEAAYGDEDVLVFGPETRGLPEDFLHRHADRRVRIPMPTGKVRSLNLAVAVGIGVYEALRRIGPKPAN